jgi:hypothetical protein
VHGSRERDHTIGITLRILSLDADGFVAAVCCERVHDEHAQDDVCE